MTEALRLAIERDLIKDSELSSPDYKVLVELSEDPAGQVRLTELAERMSWSKSRLSHQISRMEGRGLVTRRECAEDARGLWAVLTEQGLQAIQEAAPSHVDSVRNHIIDLLTPEQLDALAEISETVLASLVETCSKVRKECEQE